MEFVAVKCQNEVSAVFIDMFSFPQIKKSEIPTKPEALNIILLGLDSISRMNFIRTMSKTYDYLKNNMNAISLTGYNKIGGKLKYPHT